MLAARRLARRLAALLAFTSRGARAVAVPPQSADAPPPYSAADVDAGPRGSGNSIHMPNYNDMPKEAPAFPSVNGEYFMPTSDGGMAVFDPLGAGNAYDRITETENELTPPAGPDGPEGGFVPAAFSWGLDVSDAMAWGEHPVKGFGERHHRGPFRVFSMKLNCDAFVYASGCGGRSRGSPNSAAHCIWCVSVDVCVQGDIKTGPDAVGLATLASKGVRCDSWLTTQI